jgi:hypothetical protein
LQHVIGVFYLFYLCLLPKCSFVQLLHIP